MELSDSELRERLSAFGYNTPPITGTSRAILLKKLHSLESGIEMKSNDSDDKEEKTDGGIVLNYENHLRNRTKENTFVPEDVGLFSRCIVKQVDFWDRIGIIGTLILLIIGSVILFLIFKCLGDWSNRRFRSIYLTDPVYPICSKGGTPGLTCIPDNEIQFTESNLNIIRAAVHQAIVSGRCSRSSFESGDIVGIYPLIKYELIEKILVKELGYRYEDSNKVLKYTKIFFKANPLYDMKVLNEGILYKNYRVLGACGYLSWADSAYSYVVYAIASLATVCLIYRISQWVNNLTTSGNEERKRLIKDILDILKQNQKHTSEDHLSVAEVLKWISSAVKLRPKLWDETVNYLKTQKCGIVIERRHIGDKDIEIFKLKK